MYKSRRFKYIENLNTSHHLIFADPPYDFDIQQLTKIVGSVFQNNLLKAEGILIIEHSKHLDISQLAHFKEARKYGGSVFSFFT